jgi:hypothetical protein
MEAEQLTPGEARKMLKMGLLGTPIMLALFVGGVWMMVTIYQEHVSVLESRPPVFVHGSHNTFMYGGILAVLVAVLAPIVLVIFGLRRRRFSPPNMKRVGKIITVLGLGGLGLGFFTMIAGNHYRNHQLHQIGLVSCPNSRVVTGQFSRTAWVRDVSVCHECEFWDMVRSADKEPAYQYVLEREAQRAGGVGRGVLYP